MNDIINYQKWKPERFFYSHASKDKETSLIIEKALTKLNSDYQLYMAERKLVGRPLITKLRDEILNSNALLVSWTDNTKDVITSQIISFEIGMAYSIGLPIYILKFTDKVMPWFFDKVTDYINLSSNRQNVVFDALKKMDPFSFRHPVEILILKEKYHKYSQAKNQSENINVVADNGDLIFNKDFNGIIHFRLFNRRHKAERDVRLILKFPEEFKIVIDPGTLNGSSKVQRNEIFDIRVTSPGRVRMYWPSLPVEEFIFEIRIILTGIEKLVDNYIECLVSSENIVGWHSKKFSVKIRS